MNIKVKVVASYRAHNVSKNGKVSLSFDADYSGLADVMQLMQLLNEDVDVKVKVPSTGAMKLGAFRLDKVVVFNDGASNIKLNGIDDYVELDNLNKLPRCKEPSEGYFQVMFTADVEDTADEGEMEVDDIE